MLCPSGVATWNIKSEKPAPRYVSVMYRRNTSFIRKLISIWNNQKTVSRRQPCLHTTKFLPRRTFGQNWNVELLLCSYNSELNHSDSKENTNKVTGFPIPIKSLLHAMPIPRTVWCAAHNEVLVSLKSMSRSSMCVAL